MLFFSPGRYCCSSGGDLFQSTKWARCTIQRPDTSSHNKLVKRANSACKRISLYLPRLPRFALRSLFYQLQLCWLNRLEVSPGVRVDYREPRGFAKATLLMLEDPGMSKSQKCNVNHLVIHWGENPAWLAGAWSRQATYFMIIPLQGWNAIQVNIYFIAFLLVYVVSIQKPFWRIAPSNRKTVRLSHEPAIL